ncbi:hypothetical protein H2198_004360 [Neophaeococcomyces mojaviensis]|uniref:Uncharacterized protein n=1 Tax=Neophaeococcomyces mojaviensis TaxID=3383035 RepID=A0ACC3A8Q7_9EURO|nr:hypothetical protein H2198_004360 [Knufia sp. JES_112]
MNGDANFPVSNAPRVWIVSSADTPVGISLLRKVLDHGDFLVAGIDQAAFENGSYKSKGFKEVLTEIAEHPSRKDWRTRMKVVALDLRSQAQCQAAVASAIHTFGKLDILFCCTSQAVIGAVEELGSQTPLVREQFETNFFGPMNMIKAVIPEMRSKTHGHIIVLTGITGHLGTPGLSIYCSSQWALEGFCDSLAYEIAPFNIKLTIVQASIEIGILTNKITTAPPMSEYSPEAGHTAPLFRNILDGLLNRLPAIRAEYPPAEDIQSPSSETERASGPFLLNRDESVTLFPPLSCAHTEKLVAETVHAVTAIGGHENPPARHIVGIEGVASVKEKLKTVSEELEEFVDASVSADCGRTGDKRARRASLVSEADSRGGLRLNGADEHANHVYNAAMVLQSL